jgi:hypothetical protein
MYSVRTAQRTRKLVTGEPPGPGMWNLVTDRKCTVRALCVLIICFEVSFYKRDDGARLAKLCATELT